MKHGQFLFDPGRGSRKVYRCPHCGRTIQGPAFFSHKINCERKAPKRRANTP